MLRTLLLSLGVLASAFSGARLTRAGSSLTMKSTGTVKWFNSQKGFGFIIPDGGGDDVFVHQSVIKAEGFRSLAEGESVEYDLEEQSNGKIAAADVTGPGGGFVQGAPRTPFFDDRY